MKCLYIYGSSSAVGGHDLVSKQLSLANGSKVYFYNGTIMVQNPREPLSGSGLYGSSPMRYFADKLAGLNGYDIGFLAIRSPNAASWHEGLGLWDSDAIQATKSYIQPLLADGWLVKGIIAAIDGEFDTINEINSFARREKTVMNSWRSQFSAPQVFLLQTEMLTPNHLTADTSRRLRLYRQVQADINKTDPKTTVITTSPNWGQMPYSPLHLNVAGMKSCGDAMGTVVNNWNIAHPLEF